MKIKNKLYLGYSVVIFVVSLTGLLGLLQLNKISDSLYKEFPLSLDRISETTFLDRLAQLMRYQDEVLTQYVRNYAQSQQTIWLKRYEETEIEQEKVLNHVIQLSKAQDQIFLTNIKQAKNKASSIEQQAIQLVKEGQSEQAIVLLNNEEYWGHKEVYRLNINNYLKERGIDYFESLGASSQTHKDAIQRVMDLIKILTWSTIIFTALSVLLAFYFYYLLFQVHIKSN